VAGDHAWRDVPPVRESSERAESVDAARDDTYGDPLPPRAVLRLGTARMRHGGEIEALAFSPQGGLLASVANGRQDSVRLWDTGTGKLLWQSKDLSLSPHLAFSPDGTSLAVGDWEGTIHLLAVDNGQEFQRLSGQRGPLSFLGYADGGKRLLSAGKAPTFAVWDVATGQAVQRLAYRHASDLMQWRLALTVDGKLLVCGGKGTAEYGYWRPDIVRCWDPNVREIVGRGSGPEHPVNFAAFSPDAKTVFYGGENGLEAWQLAPSRCLRSVSYTDAGYTAFALSADGKWIASASLGGSIQLWEAAWLRHGRRFEGAGRRITALALSADGKVLASADEGVIRLWDIQTGRRLDPFPEQEDGITSVAFAQHGQLIVSAAGSTIKLWELATGKPVRRLKDDGTVGTLIALSPDEKSLASADEGTSLWDLATGRLIHRSVVPHSRVNALWFTSDNTLAFAGNTLIDDWRIDHWKAAWDTGTGKELHRSRLTFLGLPSSGEPEEILTIRAISPNRRVLVTSDYIRRISSSGPEPPIYLWDATTVTRLRQFGGKDVGARVVAFSPDGKMLATADWHTPIQLWEVLTGQERWRFPRDEGEYIHCLALSPDGRRLATGDAEGLINLWDLVSGAKMASWTGHDQDVSCLSFSPDSRLLASGSADTTVLLWDVAGLANAVAAAIAPPARDVAASWDALADADARKAYLAMWALVAVPHESVALLQKSLHPVGPVQGRVRLWIADLNSEDAAVRQRATVELRALGESARPALREVLEGKPEPDIRRRVQQLLQEPLPTLSPEEVRALRAVEALERIGTREARQELSALAQGAPEAHLTQEAKAVLERLTRRPTGK
jgi:WD40 repeat protein